ncbi:MAG TPA: putative Ig domain-containing protein [Povalibacter sp.]|nr:putative Ig domain-containing protein [Povalibacter sp.]
MSIVTRALVTSVQKIIVGLIVMSPGIAGIAQAANQPPKISGTPPTTVTVGKAYYYKFSGSDPEGAKVVFGIQNRPSWATFKTGTGELSGTPKSAGTWSNIIVSVWDGKTTVSRAPFSIKATSAASSTSNRAPTISGTPPSSVTVGNTYSFRPTASDPDGNALAFLVWNKPSWATFSTSTGQLSGKPGSAHVGTHSNILIKVTDGKVTKALPAFSITVKSATSSSGGSNAAPKISGSPATSVKAGSAYAFTPTASDANGDKLTFSISNKPAWAAFSTANGKLSGTPSSSQVGTYSNIVIKVSDGKTSASLAAFSVKVTSTTTTGAATVSWTPPTRNTDGSTLTNLAGYRIYYGTSASALNKTVELKNPGLSSYMIENLSSGTYYFGVKAFNASGAESTLSNVASKTVQ